MSKYTETATDTSDEVRVWETLIEHQQESFETTKGLIFTYVIKRNELFVSRKEKSITRSTVNRTYQKAILLMNSEGYISGPKKLGTFGASYLYSIFLKLGIIQKSK